MCMVMWKDYSTRPMQMNESSPVVTHNSTLKQYVNGRG